MPALPCRPLVVWLSVEACERAALGLTPRASHPADQQPTTHAEVGTIEHGHGTTAQLPFSVDLRSGSSLNTCDVASHAANPIMRSSSAELVNAVARSALPPAGQAT